MARTRTSPWEHIHIPTPEQMQLSDIQLQYLMLLNKLERDYGIDYVANIVKSWGKMDWQEKLDRTILLEYELEQARHDALNEYCGDSMAEYNCNRSKGHDGCHVQWDRSTKIPQIKAVWGGWR